MHFRKVVSVFLYFFALHLGTIEKASCQDSLSRHLDSLQLKQTEEISYHNLVYVSGFMSGTLNDYFYSNFYKSGYGIQLGIPLYSHQYYTVRFNLAYSTHKFQMNEYLKTDTLLENEEVKGTPLEIVTFLPDVIIHPLSKYKFSPYLNLGAGVMVGSNEPGVTKTLADGKIVKTEMPFGTKYLAQVGVGGIADVLPYLNVFAGVSYNIEFLRNHQPEDIFYKFRKLDNSFKYMYYTAGIQLKIGKKSAQKK